MAVKFALYLLFFFLLSFITLVSAQEPKKEGGHERPSFQRHPSVAAKGNLMTILWDTTMARSLFSFSFLRDHSRIRRRK